MINLPSWLFLSSFEKFRRRILMIQSLRSLLHLGRGIFGADFGSVAFVFYASAPVGGEQAYFRRLFDRHVEVRTPEAIERRFLNREDNVFLTNPKEFARIPGSPIAYWVSHRVSELFLREPSLGDALEAKQGVATGDNEQFLRYWWEVNFKSEIFVAQSKGDVDAGGFKWVAYNKGGEFRRWYGNQFFVINWEHSGKAIYDFRPKSVIRNPEYFFRRSVSWSDVTSGGSAFRVYPRGFIFDSTGHSAFPTETYTEAQVLCFTNTKIAQALFNIINPTIHLHVGYFKSLPGLRIGDRDADRIASTALSLSKKDWDSHETSWNFMRPPLVSELLSGVSLAEAYNILREKWRKTTKTLHELEEHNNRLFIDAYKLRDEFTDKVTLKEVSLSCNPIYRYGEGPSETVLEARLLADSIAEFLSYAVGCMFGRYAIVKSGLILADQGGGIKEFNTLVQRTAFVPTEDAILVILDREWVDNDVVERLRSFLLTAFGEKYFAENLAFLESSIGNDVRRYFTDDFFPRHLKQYKNRPIYWLFSSGPKKAFQALVYLHRYDEATLARMRTEYVLPLQGRMSERIDQIETDITMGLTASRHRKFTSEQDELKQQLRELMSFEAKLRNAADSRIVLDLDEGVRINYAKFGDLLDRAEVVVNVNDEEDVDAVDTEDDE